MKRVRVFLITGLAALLSLALFVPLATAGATPAPAPTNVSGYIIGYGGVGRTAWSMPVANAAMYMHDPSLPSPILVAASNTYGFYSFSQDLSVLPNKQAVFSTTPLYYHTAHHLIHSSPTQAKRFTFRCQVLPTVITGKVINKKTRKPAAYATVQILNWDVKTNRQGVYVIHATLKPQTDYKIYASKSTLKRVRKTVTSLPSDTGAVRTVNFQLAPKPR